MKYAWCLFLCLPALAQQLPRPILPQVKDYLQLTTGQLYQIAVNNDGYNRQVSERQLRIRQVMTELTAETARTDLDPLALAVRYQEIELICRELKDAALATRKLNLAVLDDRQRAKLKSLEEALALLPVLVDAQSGNLTGTWISPPSGFPSTASSNSVQLQFLGTGGPVGGCLGTGILSFFTTQ
jgi:hypothetical protein